MRRVRRSTAPLLALVLAVAGALRPQGAAAQDGRAYLALEGGYKSGDFGTETTSTLFSLAPTLGYVTPRYGVSVTAPLLSLTLETGGRKTTESGPGDVVLRAEALLLRETAGGSSVGIGAGVKLPTADEAKGLGTGETDFGVFAALHQRLLGLKLSVSGGYIVTGDPSGFEYEDVPVAGIGLAKAFGATNVSVSLEGRGATVAGADDPLEASLEGFHILGRGYALTGSATFGLNDGGPAFGATLGVVRWL